MRIRITAPDGYEGRHGVFKQGEVAVVPDDLAVKLLRHGIAVVAVETAMVAPERNAAAAVGKAAPRRTASR